MKSIDRIDEQPTAVDQPSLRLRNVFHNRRSGKDRRIGITYMDPEFDRRKGERRKNSKWTIFYGSSITSFKPACTSSTLALDSVPIFSLKLFLSTSNYHSCPSLLPAPSNSSFILLIGMIISKYLKQFRNTRQVKKAGFCSFLSRPGWLISARLFASAEKSNS